MRSIKSVKYRFIFLLGMLSLTTSFAQTNMWGFYGLQFKLDGRASLVTSACYEGVLVKKANPINKQIVGKFHADIGIDPDFYEDDDLSTSHAQITMGYMVNLGNDDILIFVGPSLTQKFEGMDDLSANITLSLCLDPEEVPLEGKVISNIFIQPSFNTHTKVWNLKVGANLVIGPK